MKKRNRIREAATLKIQTYWRMWLVKNSSFLKALEVEKYPKLYFLKEQKPQFIKILRALLPQLTKANMTIDDAISSISEDQKYDTIRVEEPDLFKFQPLPILQLAMPSFGKKTLIRENKNLGLDKVAQPNISLGNFLFMPDKEAAIH